MATYGYKKGTFSSMIELEQGMTAILKEAQQATLERMKIKLEEFITEDVYSKNVSYLTTFNETNFSKNNEEDLVEYQRTYDLYDIWNIEKVYVSHGKIYGSIEPTNHTALSHNVDKMQHASRTKGWGELTTKDYVHIINDGLEYSHSMFGTIPPRPFWDDFMKWAKTNYPIIFKEECASRGLKFN